jgi:hypothetical protein
LQRLALLILAEKNARLFFCLGGKALFVVPLKPKTSPAQSVYWGAHNVQFQKVRIFLSDNGSRFFLVDFDFNEIL